MLGNSSRRSPNYTNCSPDFAGEVSKLVLMAALAVAITLGNLLSLLVFLHVKQFRTSQGYWKISLALSDLLVGLIIVPYSVYREVNWLSSGMEQKGNQSNELACIIIGSIFTGCSFVSNTTILLLSVERSITVLKPLQKKTIITRHRTVWLIAASWTSSFCVAVIPLVTTPDITYQYNFCSKMCNYFFLPDKVPKPHRNVRLLDPVIDLSLLIGTLAITFVALHQYCKMRKQLGKELQSGNQLSFSDITCQDHWPPDLGVLTLPNKGFPQAASSQALKLQGH